MRDGRVSERARSNMGSRNGVVGQISSVGSVVALHIGVDGRRAGGAVAVAVGRGRWPWLATKNGSRNINSRAPVICTSSGAAEKRGRGGNSILPWQRSTEYRRQPKTPMIRLRRLLIWRLHELDFILKLEQTIGDLENETSYK